MFVQQFLDTCSLRLLVDKRNTGEVVDLVALVGPVSLAGNFQWLKDHLEPYPVEGDTLFLLSLSLHPLAALFIYWLSIYSNGPLCSASLLSFTFFPSNSLSTFFPHVRPHRFPETGLDQADVLSLWETWQMLIGWGKEVCPVAHPEMWYSDPPSRGFIQFQNNKLQIQLEYQSSLWLV